MNGKRGTKKPAKSKRPYKKRATKRSTIARMVKTEIHRNIENKTVQYAAQNLNIGPYVNSPNGLNAFPLTPYGGNMQIQQGTGQGDRIGNEIRTRKLVLSYVLIPSPYDSVYNPVPNGQEVKIWIGNYKPSPFVQPSTYSNFFQLGDTSTGPASTLQDILSTSNKDSWNIKKTMIHKVGFSGFSASGSGSINNNYSVNNDFKMNVVRKVDLTKLCPKVFKFNDAVSSNPTSGQGLFMMITAVDALNLTPAVRTVKLSYWIDFVYEDA